MMIGKPMAVLINKNSSRAASEIVSRRRLARQQTPPSWWVSWSFWQGERPEDHRYEKRTHADGQLKPTLTPYWRPSGVNIHRYEDAKDSDDWGVRPDKGFRRRLEATKNGWNISNSARARDVIRGKNAPREDKTEKKEKKESDADIRRDQGDPLQVSPPKAKDDKDKKENKPFQDTCARQGD